MKLKTTITFILGLLFGVWIAVGISPTMAQTEKDGRWLMGYEVLDFHGVTVCTDPFISDQMKTIECD